MNKGWLQRPECCSGSDLVHEGWMGEWGWGGRHLSMLPEFYRSHYTAVEYSRAEEKVGGQEDLALHPNMNYAAGPSRHETVYPVINA